MESLIIEDRGKIIHENVKIDEVFEAEVDKDSSWTFLFRQVDSNYNGSEIRTELSLDYF